MIKNLVIFALLVHAIRLEKDLKRLVDKHNELVDNYNTGVEKVHELQLGIDYASRVALAAFKRIPPEYQAEMRDDITFLDIAVREGE